MPKVEYYINEIMGYDTSVPPPYTEHRLSTRENLAKLFATLNYTKGAEIGVSGGVFSKILCENNPNLKLLCIDSWGLYRWESSIESAENFYKLALETLAPYSATIIRKTSIEASKDIPNGSLDFVYIDADHTFDQVMMDLIHWSPKVHRRGIVSGHDYIRHPGFGVITAVNAYVKEHGNPPLYITMNMRGCPSSWFWVQK